MVALLITSFLLLAGITYVLYLWQRPSSHEETEFMLAPPPHAIGLFDDSAINETLPRQLPGGNPVTEEERNALIERASGGDKEALHDAHATGDSALYDDVLDALVNRAETDKELLSLASFITRSERPLRVNISLAKRFMEDWKTEPDRNSTAKMLHVAALASDAGLYQVAIETAYQFWRARRLTGISADELRQLIESEFWILPPAMRNSGAGFVLKRKLAQLRRHLVAATNEE